MKLKRIMAMVLCVAMVLSTMSFSVFAEEAITVSSTAEFQAALDAATDGTTIQLLSDTTYDVVYVGRPTKSNETTMYCETHSFTTNNAEEFATHLAESGYHTTPRYTTNLKNVTIIGAEGATVAGVVATSGHSYGDVYDYVIDKDYDSGSAYYSTLNIEALKFSNVNFVGKVDINTSDADSVYDGVTFDNCTFTTGGTASSNGAAIRYYNEANNGNLKNITVDGCIFNNCYQGVYVHHVNGVTITDSEFTTTGHNAIALQSHDGAVNFGNVEISKNTFTNIGDRVIRFNEVGAGTDINITENTATNSGNADGEFMKATSIEDGATITRTDNTWNGYEDSVLADENGTLSVPAETIVATVNGVGYTDIQEAIKAAAPDGTVELLDNVTVDKWIMFSQRLSIGSGQIITLDMDGLTIKGNGKTLTVNSVESATNGDRLFHEADNLNIENLTINYADGVVGGISLKSGDLKDVTINGGVGVFPGTGDITISGCTFKTSGSAIYNEEDRDNLVVTGNHFETAEGQYAIYLRGKTTFTDNTVVTGKVNVVNGSPVVTGNNFGNERFKVYNAATAEISGNTINVLAFNDESKVNSTFGKNTLSEKAQVVLDAATAPAGPVEVSTYEELVAALEKDNANIIMKNDITATATQSSGYGKAGIVLDAGDVLDGNNHKLTINGADTKWDCAIAMRGGTVKNLTIAGAMRGIFMPGANGDVIIDNCVLEDVIYTFNSDAGSKDYTVTIKNTALNGWTSYSAVHESVTFDNCTFGEGNGYAFCRPYQPTTFTGCEFNKGFEFDTSKTADNTLEFNNCTYASEPLSEDNGEMFYNGGIVVIDEQPVNFNYVAQINDVKFKTLQEAAEAAKEGDTIKMIADTSFADAVTLPAGVTLNGNGYEIDGTIWAGGDLTFEGITKIKAFSASYYNHNITIGEGASLEITGTGRVTLGYGNVFNITGLITDAKTADKANIQASLIIPGGISITGGNDAEMNVKNAYISIGNTSSKPGEADGTFSLNFENSIAEFTNQLTLSEPQNSKNPTFEVNVKDSVLTTATKLCIAAPNTTMVIDNSTVTLGSYLRNSGELTLKNGSTLTGSMIQFGESGGNDGDIVVDGSTLTINNDNTAHAMDGKGVGSLTLKNSAVATIDYIKDSFYNVDGTSTLNVKQLIDCKEQKEPVVDAVAQIGDKKYTSLAEAFAEAQEGDTVTLLNNVTLSDADMVKESTGTYNVMLDVSGKSIMLDMNGQTINVDYNGGQYLYAVICVEDGASMTVLGDGAINIKENGENVAYMFWKRGTTGTLMVENGTYHMNDTADSMVYTNGNENVTINGGTWTLDSVNTKGDNDEPWIFNVKGAGDGHVIVTGGTYNADINRQKWSNEVLVPETHYTVKNTDNTYTVHEGAVAYVNEGMLTGNFFAPKNVGYATLTEAIKAAEARNDSPVVLIEDTTETITIADNANIVLDLGGKTLTGSILAPNATLSISNGSIVNTNTGVSAIEINAGALTLTDVNIISARHAVRIDGAVEAVINGGEYTLNATSGTRHAVNVSGAANVTIKAGTFVGPKGTTMDSGSAVCVQSGATVAIEGGNFSGGKNATLGVSGTLTVTGGTYDQDPTEYVAEGYIALENANGAYTVVQGVTIDSVADLLAFASAVTSNTEYKGVKVAANPDAVVLLTDDLNLAGSDFAPIGNGAANAFAGTFDGQNHTISNMTLSCDYYRGVGFFRSLANGAVVKNVTFDNANVDNGAAAGANHFYGVVAGFSNNLTLDNVDVKNSTVTCKYAGAVMVGCLEGATTIKNCEIDTVTLTTTNIRGAVYGILGNSENGHTATLDNNTVNNVVFVVNGEIKPIKETLVYNEWNDGTEYTEATYVAQIGDKKYSSLTEALNKAQNGETVTLIKDVTLIETANVPEGATVVLDLNGKTITSKNLNGDTMDAFTILADVTVTGNGTVNAENGYVFYVGDKNGTGGNLTIVNGTFISGDCTVAQATTGNVTIKGGTFQAAEYDGDYRYTLNCFDENYKKGTASIEVKGGTFYKFNPADNAAEGADTNFVADGYEAVNNGDGTYSVVEKEEETTTYLFKVAGTTTSLDSSLALNIYMEALGELTADDYYAVVEHEKADGTVVKTEIRYDQWVTSENYKVIRYTGIAAKEMADNITMTVYYADGTQASKPYETSLRNYALSMLNRYVATNDTSNLWLPALIDMLNYGAAAQNMFDYNTNDLATVGAGTFQQYASTEYTLDKEGCELSETVAGTTLTLEDVIQLNVYFEGVTEGMYATYSYTTHTSRKINQTVNYNSFISGWGYLGVPVDIAIADADALVTVTLFNSDGTKAGKAVYSVNAYLNDMIEKDKNEQLYPALAKFAASAKKAFAEED